MGDISRRIARLEEHIGEKACICADVGREVVCIVVDRDWDPEQIRAAEAAAEFTCPTHGRRIPNLIRIGQVEARL